MMLKNLKMVAAVAVVFSGLYLSYRALNMHSALKSGDKQAFMSG